MPIIYFIRHAEPNYEEKNDYKRGLVEIGKKAAMKLTETFSDLEIEEFYSSPFLRAVQTIQPLADSKKKKIKLMNDFCERKSAGYHIPELDFKGYAQRQWEDFNYKYEGGECLMDVQRRYTLGVQKILRGAFDHEEVYVVGCHITGLCAYLNQFGIINSYQEFVEVRDCKPWVVMEKYEGIKYQDALILGTTL